MDATMLASPAAYENHRSDHTQPFSAAARFRVSSTKASSFSESRLISTLASAPSRAAFARVIAVVRSDFMFGLVMGFSVVAILASLTAFPATPRGTLVACLRAELIAASPSLKLALPSDDLADL